MKRYYVHNHVLDNTILIDTEKKTWTFYNTNIWGQFHNLDSTPKKVSTQRINGLIKRIERGKTGLYDGYVVDQYVYNYIMTDEQREKCRYGIDLDNDPIVSGNDLKKVLTDMCKFTIENHINANENDQYYIDRIESIVS